MEALAAWEIHPKCIFFHVKCYVTHAHKHRYIHVEYFDFKNTSIYCSLWRAKEYLLSTITERYWAYTISQNNLIIKIYSINWPLYSMPSNKWSMVVWLYYQMYSLHINWMNPYFNLLLYHKCLRFFYVRQGKYTNMRFIILIICITHTWKGKGSGEKL